MHCIKSDIPIDRLQEGQRVRVLTDSLVHAPVVTITRVEKEVDSGYSYATYYVEGVLEAPDDRGRTEWKEWHLPVWTTFSLYANPASLAGTVH